MLCPVPDLARFLTGTWRIDRRIGDCNTKTVGRLIGVARFAEAPGGLDYDERGTLTLGAYEGTATRTYRFALPRPEIADIQFADGRPFHRLDLSSGWADVTHDCPPDDYRGRYQVRTQDQWTLSWLIQGPRKHLRIATRYSRS